MRRVRPSIVTPEESRYMSHSPRPPRVTSNWRSVCIHVDCSQGTTPMVANSYVLPTSPLDYQLRSQSLQARDAAQSTVIARATRPTRGAPNSASTGQAAIYRQCWERLSSSYHCSSSTFLSEIPFYATILLLLLLLCSLCYPGTKL